MDCNIVDHDKFSGGSVMIWNGICYDGCKELYRVDRGSLTSLRYRNEILYPIGRPFFDDIGVNARLVQYNARPHTAYVVQDNLELESIETIDWSARSLDRNCIEHMWAIVYRLVLGSTNPP